MKLRFGRLTTTVAMESPDIAKHIASNIREFIVSDASEKAKINVGKLARNLDVVVATAYRKAVEFAAYRMIGRPSPKGLDARQYNGGRARIVGPEGLTIANWQVLSARRIKEQNARNGTNHSGKFLLDSGELQDDVLRIAKNYIKSNSVVKVTYAERLRSKGKFVSALSAGEGQLGKVTIRLLPGIREALLPGVQSGSPLNTDPSLGFEQALGFSGEALEKLKGASNGGFIIPGTQRPLLQPVFTYWTLNKIPQVIARSIKSSMIRDKKVDGSSGAVFTGV